ncbi:hypothetical protein [uncultured Vagococcus sp.]|uniref:hypothetical protein n=1 Tax=uncultured Vagococcus sp. TaxID=189676 RepID=UPI0028D3E3F7|nr:hypothetical protein [uncultured Vagococcus sp.]
MCDDWQAVMVQVPTAALIGIMVTVDVETFNWASFKNVPKVPLMETVIMVTMIIIVVYTHSLAIGILGGVLMSLINFMSKINKLDISYSEGRVAVDDQLFFVSADSLWNCFETTCFYSNTVIDLSRTHIRN